ncbi:MAG: type I-E CRISPR-associated protein Cse1/CasA [Chlorobiales bacterium]|nr:type I-E CRISPR-associated protein Cse1/CasA [Chlorobiales bacterium]
MNLLTDQWIPVRLLEGGTPQKLLLRELLCGEEKWELCLPRDDMELAAMQLLICITQALLTPKDLAELRNRVVKPITGAEYDEAVKPFAEWFVLNHPKQPFMQVCGVKAEKPTPMDKLLAGLTGATNCCFVNEPDLAARLCPGCTAIALFNQATCTPGFGGGFKDPLRGGTPVTTLVQGPYLRATVWLNVLHEIELNRLIPWHSATKKQEPTWIEPIKSGAIPAQKIGLIRGLFWQPAYIELRAPVKSINACSCCGLESELYFEEFNKAKFSSYSVEGTWPHPHSAKILEVNAKAVKGKRFKEHLLNEYFVSFTTTAPVWTYLNRFVEQMFPRTVNDGYEPAAVVLQSRTLSKKLNLAIGGYRRSKASIVGRCHEVYTLNHGWNQHSDVIRKLVVFGLNYKNTLVESLKIFSNGLKDMRAKKVIAKGLGEKFKIYSVAESQFYRATELSIQNTLSNINFEEPGPAFIEIGFEFEKICRELFDEAVRPYRNDPELVRTMAIARNTLKNKLATLKPQ